MSDAITRAYLQNVNGRTSLFATEKITRSVDALLAGNVELGMVDMQSYSETTQTTPTEAAWTAKGTAVAQSLKSNEW